MPENEEVQVMDLLVVADSKPDSSSNGAYKSNKPKSKETKSIIRSKPRSISKYQLANARGLQERCRQLCLTLFFDEHAPIHGLGFTSPLAGEGKTFLSAVTAGGLANDSPYPVGRVEVNWDHPTLHDD